MDIQPLIEGQYFHIYNRGVNGEDLFKEERNYYYFLQQYKLYCSDVLETLAYCLLKNHFHLLVYIKENVEVPRKDGQGMFKMNTSKQLGHFFNSYAQSINKAHKRTGPLFESPFERKWVDNESYLTSMIYYCHWNAQHHDFVKDFRQWEYSSYGIITKNDNALVATEKVLTRFGNVAAFEDAHSIFLEDQELNKYIIEY
jgi:REP element-mobilizing transposase RayT